MIQVHVNYHIHFTADDGKQGGQSSGEVIVSVLNERSGKRPVDSGSIYDSTEQNSLSITTGTQDTTPPAIIATTP